MKALILSLLISLSYSYEIGGAYAQLIKCEVGQLGYEFGFIGTYRVNGQYYKVFFKDYCEY